MRRMMACILLAGALSTAALAGDARLRAIQEDPQALRNAQAAGKKASFFCVNCHGGNGVSKLPEVPNLAGQNADYLLEQTRRFGRGQRKDEFMQGLIKVLKEEEKIQISLFYAGQNPKPGKPDSAQAAKGKQIYTRLCLRCHGSTAHGNETIPRLASQHPKYTILSVKRYRNKTGERQEAQMTSAVAPLKDADIEAVAAYLYSLP